jgi:hypothetical protein
MPPSLQVVGLPWGVGVQQRCCHHAAQQMVAWEEEDHKEGGLEVFLTAAKTSLWRPRLKAKGAV